MSTLMIKIQKRFYLIIFYEKDNKNVKLQFLALEAYLYSTILFSFTYCKIYPFSQLQNYNNNGITYNKEKRLNSKLTQEVCYNNELEFEFCSENI